MTLELFTGETKLHLGKKHTFNHIATAILDKLSKVEAEILLITLEAKMKQPRFLKQERELQELFAKIKKEQELSK